MIKQLQMGFRLLRYAHGIKTCVLASIGMLVYGIVIEWSAGPVTGTDVKSLQNAGGYLILTCAMWPLQMLISLNVPDVVASSPWKKRIQTSVFSIVSAVSYLIGYVIVVCIKMMKYSQGVLSAENLTFELLGMPLVLILQMIYIAICLKYFIVSTIVFCFCMSVLGFGYTLVHYAGWFTIGGISPVTAVIIGGGSIIISAILSYGISCLVYKKPVSKYSQMNSLQKRM